MRRTSLSSAAICLLLMLGVFVRASSKFNSGLGMPDLNAPNSTPIPAIHVESSTRPSRAAQLILDPLSDFKIVCIFNNKNYYKTYFTPAMIDSHMCTHINYEFAILDPKTYEMISGEPDLDLGMNFYQEAVDLRKKHNPSLKIMLSLGGWADSTKKYSEMASDPDKRKNFIDKAVSFITAHEFDGMDLAWEYPNCWQGAIGVSPKDKKNFVILLKEMRPAFDAKKLELSCSVGAIKREVDVAYDVAAISAVVNHINVMTYDMHGPWEPVTGHHSQFEIAAGDSDPFCNVKSAMQIWIDQGANKKKLIMGVPFYAKTFTLADPSRSELGAKAIGIGNAGPISKNGGLLYYSEMCKFLNAGNWTEKEVNGIGYYSVAGDQWACYDPPLMVVKKARYVCDTGLGGLLLKDLSNDDFKGACFNFTFPLTKMVKMEITQVVRRQRLHA